MDQNILSEETWDEDQRRLRLAEQALYRQSIERLQRRIRHMRQIIKDLCELIPEERILERDSTKSLVQNIQ